MEQPPKKLLDQVREVIQCEKASGMQKRILYLASLRIPFQQSFSRTTL